MKTNTCLLFSVCVLNLYLTSCKVVYPPLRHETNLQHKIDPPKESNIVSTLGGDAAVANQIRNTPAITTYFASPNEPFELSVIADYIVEELDGLERLFVNPVPLSPQDELELSRLTLNKNNQLLVEITDFGNNFSVDDIFSHSLPNLVVPATNGQTDHYEFIGYWRDGKNRTLAQGIWVDVTAKGSAEGTSPAIHSANSRPDRIRIQGGATLAAKGGKDEYDYGNDDTKHPLKPGFLLGASVPFQLSSMFSVEAGLQVETKGAIEKYEYEDEYEPGQGNVFGRASAAQLTAATLKSKSTLTYLGIPLLAYVSPIPQVSNLGFIGGLQPSFLLGRKAKSSGFGSENTEKGTDGFKTLDAGLLIGAAYQLENGLGFRLAYEHGLVDITENEFETYKNRSIKLSATYDIPIHLISKK